MGRKDSSRAVRASFRLPFPRSPPPTFRLDQATLPSLLRRDVESTSMKRVLVLAAVLAALSGPALAQQNIPRPPAVLSPDLTGPWVTQLGTNYRPAISDPTHYRPANQPPPLGTQMAA